MPFFEQMQKAANPNFQLAGAEEYTDCISAVGQDSPNECPG